MRRVLVSACLLSVARAQSSGAAALGAASGDTAAMAANMQKLSELYGFATQMMKLGGSFMGSTRGGSSSSSSAAALSPYADYAGPSSPSSSFMPSYSNYGGNGILSDFASSGGSERGYGGGGGSNGMLARAAQTFLSEYGGGLQTASRSQAPPPRGQSGFQSLLNTFLGSSVTEENLPPPPTPRPRPQRSLFEQFLGYSAGGAKAAGTTTYGDEDSLPPPPPPRAPAQNSRLMPSFADLLSPSYDSKPSQQLNFLELLGMERPTTTTTRRPLYIFDKGEKYGLAQGASDIDGILNALMRSGARPSPPVEAEQPPSPSASLLASFLGKKK